MALLGRGQKFQSSSINCNFYLPALQPTSLFHGPPRLISFLSSLTPRIATFFSPPARGFQITEGGKRDVLDPVIIVSISKGCRSRGNLGNFSENDESIRKKLFLLSRRRVTFRRKKWCEVAFAIVQLAIICLSRNQRISFPNFFDNPD